jgi:hypothetical protein
MMHSIWHVSLLHTTLLFTDLSLTIGSVNPLAREFCLSVCDAPQKPMDNNLGE